MDDVMKNATKPIVRFILLIAVLFLIPHTSHSQQTAGQLFEKALYMEEATGDLEQGIALYQQILEAFPDDREFAAKSMLHLGICFEKQGLQKARGTYQDVINKYPDRQDEVTLARERLNRLLALQMAPTKPSFRQIRIPTEISWNVALSPDGQSILLVSDKKLWRMPLSGKLGQDFPGNPIHISTGNLPVEWTGLAWSANGEWIAFNDILPRDSLKEQNWKQSIYVVPSEGGQPRKVIKNYRAARVVNYRISLSPDGKYLAYSSIEDNKTHVYTIPVEGGTPNRLVDFQAREPVFSPDGKMIALVENQFLGRFGGSLYTIPASGGSPSLVTESKNASSPVWSPDASKIAFLDSDETPDINIIGVDQYGKPIGEKITIMAPEGRLFRLLTGWSTDNKIGALMLTRHEFALYTLPEQGGQASMIYYGSGSQPRWSPDGKQIFFAKGYQQDTIPPNLAISVIPAEGGERRDILVGSEDRIIFQPYSAGIRISPDGKKIVMSAKSYDDTVLIDNDPTMQIWTTTVDGENLAQITQPDVPYTDYNPCWSPDGKSIAFVRTKLQEGQSDQPMERGIYIINPSGGTPKLLKSEYNKWITTMLWSPNGKLIAYITGEKDPPKKKELILFDVEDGTSRILAEVPDASAHIELAWSPDSKRIAVNEFDVKHPSPIIKIVSVDDGSIQDIETGLVDYHIIHLDWSPDGKTFVFGGWKDGKKEFWLMENFLPETETGK
jgi:Tol biopolymer transport system component